jgi:uncharacterized protein YlxP (DUF503 family)
MSTQTQSLTMLLCLTALTCFGCRAEKTETSQYQVRKADRVELIELIESDHRPAIFAKLQFLSADGTLEKIQLPAKADELKKIIEVTGVKSGLQRKAKEGFKVIYASAPAKESDSLEKLDVMLLFDVSGSMAAMEGNSTRFESSVNAARALLRNYKPGFRIAIAPFDSHDVKSRIENAPFAESAEQAEAQLNNMRTMFNSRSSAEHKKANTALYNSVSYALDRLGARQQKDPARRYSLFVLTDGEDFVKAGDDSQVLDAKVALDVSAEKVRQFKGEVFAIGVGAGVNPTDLKKLSGDRPNDQRYFPVTSPGTLEGVLTKTKESLSENLSIIFLPPYKSYRELGSEMEFNLKVTAGNKTYKGVIPWRSQSVTGPVLDGKLSEKLSLEDRNLIFASLGEQTSSLNWQDILKLFGKLAALSLILAGFWFLVPRLIWPGPSLPSLPQRGGQKASIPKASTGGRSASSELPASAKPRQRFEETRIHDGRNRQ